MAERRAGIRRQPTQVAARGLTDERNGGRADHRLRRVGRRGGLEPGRDEDAHPVPGTGRLDEAGRLPEQRAGLGGAAVRRLRHQSEPAGAAVGLSDQRRQLADQGGELQRGRRQHHHVHGALSAVASVGLPGALAGWRRRRLADRLRDAGAVLRRERPHDGRLGTGRRSGLSAEAAADAAAAARARAARGSARR